MATSLEFILFTNRKKILFFLPLFQGIIFIRLFYKSKSISKLLAGLFKKKLLNINRKIFIINHVYKVKKF